MKLCNFCLCKLSVLLPFIDHYIMSETPKLDVKPENTVVTLELLHIIKEINNRDYWWSIFNNHCERTGKPTILHNQISKTRDALFGEQLEMYLVTWQGREYRAYCRAGLEELYQGIVHSIITAELAKNT